MSAKVKKVILMRIPMTICNFRCHYCYLAQQNDTFTGIQPQMKYSPQQVAYALRKERVGGSAFINMCADGETLLVKNLSEYIKALAEEGHYIEIVTNLTVTPALDKILLFDKELLKHITFKCSFHYLELKNKQLLQIFAENVKKIWDAGASANIEMMPVDEYIPFIDEIKEFSMKHFGALPQLSIARDDRTSGIDHLTKLDMEAYNNIWSQFDSNFWYYKRSIFGVKQTGFCYAGQWSMYLNLCSGFATQCYCHREKPKDIFADPEKPLPLGAIGSCLEPHCYNGHALMTLGLIPGATDVRYGDIRNRIRSDSGQWIQPEMLDFLNSKLVESNTEFSLSQKRMVKIKNNLRFIANVPHKVLGKVKNIVKS